MYRNFNAFFERFSFLAPLIIRLLIGFHLVYGTHDKIFSTKSMLSIISWFQTQGIPFPSFSAYLSAYCQFFCGLLFLVGIFTRMAGLIMVINFVCAIAFVHIGDTYSNTFPALVMLSGSLYLLFNGAGSMAVERNKDLSKPTSFLFLIFGLSLFSCDTSEKLSEEEMKAIVHKYNERLEKSFLAQDTLALREIYAPDARLCPDGDTFYVGTNDILRFWKNDFATSKLLKMSTNTFSVNGNAEVIYETGITETETLQKDSVYKSVVKFINVWRRQSDKSYRLSIDFWNRLNE